MDSLTAEKCLLIVHHALGELAKRNFPGADRELAAALAAVRMLPKAESETIFPLVTASLCLLRTRQGKLDDAAKLRTISMQLMDQFHTLEGNKIFPQLAANVLNDLQEYHRAIPFFEEAAQLLSERNDPLGVARNLAHAGNCYCRCGLIDHGAVPLRAAIKIYRDHPGDPHLPDALLNLGNALRNSSPAEAESAYKEAANFYEAKMQLASASPAWVNLGVLCSKQDRHAEALAWYEKALRVREQASGTPPSRIGSLLNNIANCHRRTGNFDEAHRLLDRAIPLLAADPPYLAAAYGTRGLILSDQGRDAEAVEWLQKAITEQQKLPSPNLETVATDLEYAIVSLRRLNRPEEAANAESLLNTMRQAQRDFPPASVNLNALENASATAHAGAVLIEVDCGLRSGTRFTVADAVKLSDDLTAAAKAHHTGFCGGRVVIPESTTLMFYGEDAEALFLSLQPVFENHSVCNGARISIRQGTNLRELSLPSRIM
jgi:tetratricopeptide (TPR) repeat protein